MGWSRPAPNLHQKSAAPATHLPQGCTPAREAARVLAEVGLSEVFSGPLLRTRHTAEAIASLAAKNIALFSELEALRTPVIGLIWC